jgi:hypothetical protein
MKTFIAIKVATAFPCLLAVVGEAKEVTASVVTSAVLVEWFSRG